MGSYTWALAHAQENHALYISGLRIGKGHEAILRLTNLSQHAEDQYAVNFSVLETSAGRQVNSFTNNTRFLFRGDTLQLDIAAIVKAHQASLGENGNAKFKGPVQVVLSATGGQFAAFGPGVIAVQAFTKEGQARYQTSIRWFGYGKLNLGIEH